MADYASNISDQISTVSTNLSTIMETIDAAVDDMNLLLTEIDGGSISYSELSSPEEIVPTTPDDKPGDWSETISDVQSWILSDSSAPTSPTMNTISTIDEQDFVDVPDAPSISFPDAPTVFSDDAPDAPSIESPDIPDAPEYSLPTAPDETEIVVPDTPDFMDLPTFDVSAPDEIADPELQGLSFSEAEYASELADLADAWLQYQVENGGTGLAEDVEQAIFDRSLSRETEKFRLNIESASDEFAASGFPRPSGALRARLDQIRSAYNNQVEDLNRKIAEDQANLAQENTHFAITESAKREATLLQHYNQVQDRTLKYAIALVDTAKAIYNLKVTNYQAKLEGYKTEASVFQTLLQAAVVEVDRYKAILGATQIEVEVDKAKVELYTQRISAVKVLADFYNSELNAAKTKADIEALKLQVFQAQVESFEAEIKAKELEYTGYRAEIDGEAAKVDVYKAEIQGVLAANESKKTIVETQKAIVDSELAVNQEKLQIYASEIDAYKVLISQNIDVIRSAVSAYNAQVDIYKANITQASIENEVNTKNVELALKKAEINVREANERYQLTAKLLKERFAAGIQGQSDTIQALGSMAAGIASQINTISQITSYEDVSE